MGRAVIACDLGTGGAKSAIIDEDGRVLADRVVGYETLYPVPGLHEQRPDDWFRAVADSIRGLAALPQAQSSDIRAIAVSGHSLGCVPVDAKGALLQDVTPIWSDGRAGEDAARFFERYDYNDWYRITGNGFPAPLYTLFKLLWLRRRRPEIFAATRTVLGTKDYVNFRLTGRRATDHSYASGAGVYDLAAGGYSAALLAAADFDSTLFPPILASTDTVGELLPEVAVDLGLPPGIVVIAGGVDNSCMALGARTFREGDVFCSMGSSSWLTVATRKPLSDDRVRPYTFAHVVPDMFISATSIFSSGTSLDWVCETLLPDLIQGAREAKRDPYEALTELARSAPTGSGGLLFVPTLGGGTNLEGGPAVRGGFVGLDLGHGRAHILRATLEGVALALRVALDELRRMTPIGDEMIMVGGGARNALWRQIFADLFHCTILKTAIDRQAAAYGAAALALVGAGLWRDFSPILAFHVLEEASVPVPGREKLVSQMLSAYRLAADQQRSLADKLVEIRKAV
jgi:xylulokinase